jgi:hypothetical protein
MNYEQYTLKNRSLLRRFSHRSRFAIALEMLDPQPGDRVLDYGTGDAELLVQLSHSRDGLSLAAYEPNAWCLAQAIEKTAGLDPKPLVTPDFATLAGFAPNKVACLEVLEHLPDALLDTALQHLSALARAGATILVSVPIEVGPPALLKYLVRIRTEASQRHPWSEVWGALRGDTRNIPRVPQDGYIFHHLGFDFRTLPERFRKHGLAIRRRRFSPISWLGSAFNSQVFYLLSADRA